MQAHDLALDRPLVFRISVDWSGVARAEPSGHAGLDACVTSALAHAAFLVGEKLEISWPLNTDPIARP